MSKAIKLLVNGKAGIGKTSLLRSLDKDTFVISRDAKNFSLPLPHFLVEHWTGMEPFLYGYKGENDEHIPGVFDKMEAYNEKFGGYPKNVIIDSVSQIFLDVIEKAALTPNVYGSQGAEVTKEIGILTKFIHEDLEMNGINVILLNHVITEKVDGKPTGAVLPFGSGKFNEKSGFFSTTNESITIVPEGSYRVVYFSSLPKLARTQLTNLPDKQYIEDFKHPEKNKKLKEGETYFSLKDHLQKLIDNQEEIGTWSL